MNPKNEKKIQRGMSPPPHPPPIKIGGGKCVVVQSVYVSLTPQSHRKGKVCGGSKRVCQLDAAVPQKHADSISVNFVEEPAAEDKLVSVGP